MRNFVVDSSVVIKCLVAEPNSSDAARLLDECQAGAASFLAPGVLVAEVGNIVWKKHRFQGLAIDDALLVLRAFQALTFTLTQSSVLLSDAFQLATAHQRTVYDSLYLALSAREHCPFVTADEKLANAVRGVLPDVVFVADWS